MDFQFKDFQIGGKTVKLQIWDTVGQERYRSLCNIYFKSADIIVLVFDLTNAVL